MPNNKKYNQTFITKALLLYQKNNYNEKGTCDEIGISPRTLNNWKSKYGAEVLKSESLSPDELMVIPEERKKAIQGLREEIILNEKGYLEEISKARDLAIERAITLLEKETDLNKVTNFIRIAQEIMTGEQIKTLEERNNRSNFFTQIVNKQFVTNNVLNQHEGNKE